MEFPEASGSCQRRGLKDSTDVQAEPQAASARAAGRGSGTQGATCRGREWGRPPCAATGLLSSRLLPQQLSPLSRHCPSPSWSLLTGLNCFAEKLVFARRRPDPHDHRPLLPGNSLSLCASHVPAQTPGLLISGGAVKPASFRGHVQPLNFWHIPFCRDCSTPAYDAETPPRRPTWP